MQRSSSTDDAGSAEVAERRSGASESQQPTSGMRQTSSSCFREVPACSGRVATSAITTAARRFKRWWSPVITVRTTPTVAAESGKERLTVTNLPYEITNRIFSVIMELGGPNLALFANTTVVKPVLLSGSTQVGAVGVAIGGELDQAAGTVAIQPGKPVTVGFLLSGEDVDAVRIVVRDPATDAELYRSPVEIPVRLGVG